MKVTEYLLLAAVMGVLVIVTLFGDVIISGRTPEPQRAVVTNYCNPGLSFNRISGRCEPGALQAVNNPGMQPFGIGQEDDDTAQLAVLPTHSPQVTQHYVFLQGSK